MKRAVKSMLIATAVLAALGGGWFAWDRGLVPGNPRAPTAQIMQAAVLRAADPLLRASRACVGPDASPAPDIQGTHGIAQRPFPGQYAVTYLLEGGLRDQAERERVIRQHTYLAQHGLFTESAVMLETDAGPRAAKRFDLTWQGFAQLQPAGRSLCFQIGQENLLGITRIQRLPEGVDLELYEVGYEHAPAALPAWAAAEEGKALFPRLGELTARKQQTVRLVRSRDGWITEAELQWQLQLAKLGAEGMQARELAAHMRRAHTVAPAPTPEAAARALGEHFASRTERGALACLPVRVSRGDDAGGAAAPGTFTATWYDLPPEGRRDFQRASMLSQLHLLSALESAGFATLEAAKSGVRYVLGAQGVEAVGAGGAHCLPAGRMELSVLAVNAHGPDATLVGRATLTGTPDWVAALAGQLPALGSIVKEGIPLTAGLVHAGTAGAESWHVASLRIAYPEIAADRLPNHLQPLMPETLRATATALKAPVRPGAPSRTVMQPALQGAPVVVSAAPFGSAPARGAPARPPLYPAGGAEVHLIAVYEGSKPSGEVHVHVGATANAAMLMLVAYERVEWKIAVAPGSRLAKVVAIGVKEGRVTLSGSGGVEVAIRRFDVFEAAGVGVGANGFPYEPRGNSARDAAELAQAITGKQPATFQGRYTGNGYFPINSGTPPLVLSAPQLVTARKEDVTLVTLPHQRGVTGLSLTYGGAGAYTEAWSSRPVGAGKAYFEGRISVQGGLSAVQHANIGLGTARGEGTLDDEVPLIADGEQRLYRDGDVFGVAVDFDAGIAYLRVNGRWVTGEPGSGKGHSFKARRDRVAYFFATGGDNGRGLTGWRANFGASAFQHPLPKGYTSWDGAQRG